MFRCAYNSGRGRAVSYILIGGQCEGPNAGYNCNRLPRLFFVQLHCAYSRFRRGVSEADNSCVC
jgi:hypothetical protein